MKKILHISINFLFLLFVVAVAFSIATIALTKKVNESKVYVHALQGSVTKHQVVVLTLSRGIIAKIYVKNGQQVKKGDLLVQMTNPILEDAFKVYQQHANNESAQTEASIAKVSLDNLKITAPVNGTIANIAIAEGSSIDQFSKVMVIDSSSDVRLQADLTAEQYQQIQKLFQITAYNTRLNQDFTIVPSLLKADEQTPVNVSEKRIGLYFTFKNNDQAASLINNEDLDINLDDNSKTPKPIDIFIAFWNGLIAKS